MGARSAGGVEEVGLCPLSARALHAMLALCTVPTLCCAVPAIPAPSPHHPRPRPAPAAPVPPFARGGGHLPLPPPRTQGYQEHPLPQLSHRSPKMSQR